MALLITNILCKLKYSGILKVAYLAEVCVSIEMSASNNIKMGEGKE